MPAPWRPAPPGRSGRPPVRLAEARPFPPCRDPCDRRHARHRYARCGTAPSRLSRPLPAPPASATAPPLPAPLRPALRGRCPSVPAPPWSRAHQAGPSPCPLVDDRRTTALQAIPSARPSAPSPSALVAFTLTGPPSTADQPVGHQVHEGGQPWPLGHHRAVGVDRRPSGPAGELDHVGQDVHAVGPLPPRVGVGSVTTEVAETGRTEHGVGDGVGHGVGVAVPVERPGAVTGDDHPTEDQRTVRAVGEPVDVEPLADPNGRRSAVHRSATFIRASASTEILGPGQLQVAWVPHHRAHRCPQVLQQPGIVRRLSARVVCVPEGWPPRRPAVSGRRPTRRGRRCAARCRRRRASGCRRPEAPGWPRPPRGADGIDDRGEQRPGGQGPGSVVDHDDDRIVRDGDQPGPYRCRPGGPAGHHPVRTECMGGWLPVTVPHRLRSPPPGPRGPPRRPPSGPPPPTTPPPVGRPARRTAWASEPASGPARHHDGPDGPGSAQGSASLSRTSAVSSSTPSAKVSSDTRIWRARLSMRFSPAESPLSLSRMERFLTTSATW